MAKILVLCVTLGVLVVIAESKSLRITEEACPGCGEYFVAPLKPQPLGIEPDRARAPEIIDSVTGLLRDGILLPTWNGIVQVNKYKTQPRRNTYTFGRGRGNNNRVMINNNDDDYYDDDDNGRNVNSFNNRRSQRNNYY